ncbi:Deoxycytidylate deaminase [Cladobotryum mycophilum]|uniref:Deoxycytidylate deaminase n=1 Tax=Cladobotryum mycophilum TaxID=491253 RepID=A0ABR0SJJ2_9HYPO
MLIGICGSICSGKRTVAQYLVEHHGFRPLYLRPKSEVADEATPPSDSGGDNNGNAGTDSSPAASTEALDTGTVADGNGQRFAHQRSLGLRPGSEGPHHIFETPEELLEFVTQRWRKRFVTTDIPTEAVLDVFIRRPFFLLISTDAPLTVRWRRFQQRSNEPGDSSINLEDFVTKNDHHLYDQSAGLQPLISRATVRLLNTSSSLAHLYATLGKLDMPNPERLRPCWDTYFMALASLAAQRSNCMKRRVGIKICQVGIREVVYAHRYSMDNETADVFRQAGVKLRQFIPPAKLQRTREERRSMDGAGVRLETTAQKRNETETKDKGSKNRGQ